MKLQTVPTDIFLKRDEKLVITWGDGLVSTYPLAQLRSQCPCALCKTIREQQQQIRSRLNILPGNYAGELKVETMEQVGNYALRIDWSDQHGSGIYSYQYLREMGEEKK